VIADAVSTARRDDPRMELRSGDALFTFDGDLTILSWNRAAEELTGIPTATAVGRRCFEVLGGVDERGSLVCHSGCSGARLAAEGWPVRPQRLRLRSGQQLGVSTIAVQNGDAPVYLHLLRDEAPVEAVKAPTRQARLTPRQLEVLELIDEGLAAKAISSRLDIAEATVRNHIRSILLELGCHSQLEALAVARRRGFL
jgi:DNA-binding CsgD family transcriptional regulator